MTKTDKPSQPASSRQPERGITRTSRSRVIRKITYCALLLAIGFLLPFLTGQIPAIASSLSPLHIPALLSGFLVGPVWGAVCSFLLPLLRSLIFHMPSLYPMAVTMAFECATYAAVGGICWRLFPKKARFLYAAQGIAMVAGRVVYGVVFAFLTLMSADLSYSFAAFITGCFVEAVPGILLHLILVPPIVLALRRAKLTVE